MEDPCWNADQGKYLDLILDGLQKISRNRYNYCHYNKSKYSLKNSDKNKNNDINLGVRI